MATTTNLFDLLSGIGKSEQLQTLKKKAKPKKAKKPEAAALANGVHEDQNGSPSDLEVSGVAESVSTVLPSAHVLKTPAQPQYVVIEASEAVAICERAAREAKSLTDKIKLWKDWTRQVWNIHKRRPFCVKHASTRFPNSHLTTSSYPFDRPLTDRAGA